MVQKMLNEKKGFPDSESDVQNIKIQKLFFFNVQQSRDKKLCNCRIKVNCPLGNKCLSDNIVYEARVSVGNKKFSYIGSTGTVFNSPTNDFPNMSIPPPSINSC